MSAAESRAGLVAQLAQYDSFAALARSAAAGEQLENVRQKHLTSAVTWEQLAANARKWEARRVRLIAEEQSAKPSPPTPSAKPLALARVDDAPRWPARLAGRSGILIG